MLVRGVAVVVWMNVGDGDALARPDLDLEDVQSFRSDRFAPSLLHGLW